MTDRDRLIKLKAEATDKYQAMPFVNGSKIDFDCFLADYLLANGVIVPIRCKDCMFYKHTEIGDCMACVRQTAYKKPNDFCSCAKLKEREG